MPMRRQCDPVNVKAIWDAIRSANLQNQIADAARISRFLMKNSQCTQQQCELYIKQALNDNLITTVRRPTGEANSTHYKITTQELPCFDGKDWYCFECHRAGEVTTCLKCFRVYHYDCIKVAKRKYLIQVKAIQNSVDSATVYNDYDENLCGVCNITNLDSGSFLSVTDLNYLLKFLLHRIRAWLPNTITHTMAREDRADWLTDSELTWRANQLFFEHKDMSVIEVKLNSESYNMMSEFLADIYTIEHNVAVFHGTESQEHEASECMVQDTVYELGEMRNCPDCYRHSNEKINVKWFMLPCRNAHELVWAKQKGYPYWPAKVIKKTSTHYDVRFFGGKYERALLPKKLVKPISLPSNRLPESSKVKPAVAFKKACEELEYHQKLLSDPAELAKVMSDVKPKRTVGRPPTTSTPRSVGRPPTTSTPVVRPTRPVGRPPPSTTSKHRQSTNRRNSVESVSTVEQSGGDDNSLVMEDESSGADDSAAAGPSSVTAEDQEGVKKESLKHSLVSDDGSESEPLKKQRLNSDDTTSPPKISGGNNVIDISDGDDEESKFPLNGSTTRFDESYEQVSSSQDIGTPPWKYCEAVETMRSKAEMLTNKQDIIKCAMDCMQAEIESHNDHLRKLFEAHNAQISDIKKKQWCYNCEQDAIYHCCWNTAYCSQLCQQQHWQAEHKKHCKRKRQA